MKYEITHCPVPEGEPEYCAALLSIVTGLPLRATDELPGVWEQLPARLRKSSGWYGRDFVEAARGMGFDCSPDFRAKFDPATPYPCLLRYRPTARQLVRERAKKRAATGNPAATVQPWWNLLAYYDGLVYNPHDAAPWPLARWNHEGFRITSMMQVWMGRL